MSSQRKHYSPTPTNGLTSQSTQQLLPICTWSAHPPQSRPSPSPLPRASHTLTATAAGEFLLFGGWVHRYHTSNDLYVFSTRDFSTTLLQTSGEVPTPRAEHGAALIGNNLLIYGGTTQSGDQYVLNHDTLTWNVLDLVSREWTRVVVYGPGPNGRRNYTTTVVGSKLFVFGGYDSGTSNKIFNDMWAVDLSCLKPQPVWGSYEPAPGKNKPLPRYGHVSVTTEDRIIIFGGYGSQHYYNDTWSFDIPTRKWAELLCTGSIPSGRCGHAAVLVDGVMYVFGGNSGKSLLDDLYALQLSTQQWFKFHNVGPIPYARTCPAMASDGTHVFVLGGYSPSARSDEISLIHVFDTKDIEYPPDPEPNSADPNEKTTQLAEKSSTGPPTQERLQNQKSPSSEAHGASHLENSTHAVSGRPASGRLPGPNGDVSEDSTEYRDSSEGEATRLVLERQLSVSFAAQTERDHRIALLTDELARKSALIEQAEANAVETARRAGLELREHVDDRQLMQTSLVKQRDAEFVDMQVKPTDMQAMLTDMHARLTDMQAKFDELLLSRDQQIGQYEKELTNVRAKLEAKESELEAVRLRLTDAEKALTNKSKAELDTLRTQTATGSVNRDEDQVTRRLMERVQAIEVEMTSRRWNKKSIEEMECRNEG